MRKSSLPEPAGLALALLAGLAVFPVLGRTAPSTATFRDAVRSMGMDCPGACGFVIDRSQLRGDWDGGQRAYWTILASSGPAKVRLDAVRDLDREEAGRMKKERFAVIRGLFQGAAEYPGIITQDFEVAADLKPVEVPEKPLGAETLLLYATPRLTYGAGASDLVSYRALFSFRYCPRDRLLVQVELFYPKESFLREPALDRLRGFSCR